MNYLKVIVGLIFLITSISLYSQQDKPALQTIKPTVVLEDVVFAVNVLDNIEITGAEVDAFLTVRTSLNKILLQAQQAKMGATDTVKISITVNVAQDLINLLQRAKFTGANAVKYKRFVDAILKSAQLLPQKKEEK